ncbi:DUF3307 domain-containing protein [Shinella pollutisoli]|uniref:DUF3307 domain-containing protein n=1 Tax=Shinella pollutisoli TaxID=2250594 RepID=A0ABV7DMH3_9HYPH|nr:DUF3307 domain-containing protein [Shinella pollutisoli]
MSGLPQELSTLAVAVAVAAFLAKHFLADFLLQTDWMAAGKDRAEGWLLPLSAHLAVHGAMTAALFLAVAPSLAWLGLVDMAVHGLIDRMKSVASRRAGPAPRQTAFWWLFGADQTLHHLTHLPFALLFAAHLAV